MANLSLARNLTRERELAVRSALGGNRRRLARQLLAESLLVASLGGLAGLAVAAGPRPASPNAACAAPWWWPARMV